MNAQDHYAVLGVARDASTDQIRRAYRKLARKYHPDVSKEPDAEERFKSVAEAWDVLGDSTRRAAHDGTVPGPQGRRSNGSADDWNGHPDAAGGPDFEGSAFFDELFRRQASGERGPRGAEQSIGGDQHARVRIALIDVYRGALRSVSLSVPEIDSEGLVTLRERQLDVKIPKGICAGQRLRLAGQGAAATSHGAAGDLYLEIEIAEQPPFRVEGRNVYLELPVAPWEAALGASVTVPTPDGSVRLTVPAASSGGRKLRLKGRGIPGSPSGDLYVLLAIALPPANTEADREAWQRMADSFADFHPRHALET